MGNKTIYLGSHVGMNAPEYYLGSVKEALSYGSTTFMFYTGAPQNSYRKPLNELRIEEGRKLLKEAGIDAEARLIPKPGERMTIEMRIFALILLGIDSSAKIAQLLCYSPNTISNYRVKIKNSALGDRDAFERKVRKIGTLKD